MTLGAIIGLLIVVGLLLYLLNMLPIDGNIKNIIYVVVLVAVILWVISALGLFSGVLNQPIRLR
jgi:hypothetical protein